MAALPTSEAVSPRFRTEGFVLVSGVSPGEQGGRLLCSLVWFLWGAKVPPFNDGFALETRICLVGDNDFETYILALSPLLPSLSLHHFPHPLIALHLLCSEMPSACTANPLQNAFEPYTGQ